MNSKKAISVASLLCSALFWLAGAGNVAAQETISSYPYVENFDESTELPANWAVSGSSPFSVASAMDYGRTADSGPNLLASGYPQTSNRTDVAFSPMMEMKGGVEYTMTVKVMMPGIGNGRNPGMQVTVGQAQVSEAHTQVLVERDEVIADWEEVKVTFTPETDGAYCFGLWATSGLSSAGDIFYDTFSLSSGETGGETWQATLPYTETFDDATHYSGTEYLPIGWLSTGESPFATLSSNSIPALSGEYYMMGLPSVINNRRDIAYTPMFDMEGGKNYIISYYLCMPGDVNPASFRLTAGMGQSLEMQSVTLQEVNGERISDWQKCEFVFTPEFTGAYCFAFWACSEQINDGYICVENLVIRRAEDVLPPTVLIEPGNTLHSVFSSQPLLMPGQELKMVNLTEGATEYKWQVDGNAEISDDTDFEPTIKFPVSGTYNITLEASNAGGSSSQTISFTAEVLTGDSDRDDALQSASEEDYIFQQSDLPAFSEDGDVIESSTYEVYYNYVVGQNPYYRAFAERFELPAEQELTINSLSVMMMMYYIFSEEGGEVPINDEDKNFRLAFYPEKDGEPDLDKPFYMDTLNIIETFGDYGLYLPERHSVQLETPAKVKGTFYVAFELDSLLLEAGRNNNRSWFGCDTRRHHNRQTTLYVLPESALPGSDFVPDGTYCRADEFCPELEGYSFTVMPWVTIHKQTPSTVGSIENDVTVSVSANGHDYRVTGLPDGIDVRVWSLSGMLVFSSKSLDGEVFIPAEGWARGVYVITADDGISVKIMK